MSWNIYIIHVPVPAILNCMAPYFDRLTFPHPTPHVGARRFQGARGGKIPPDDTDNKREVPGESMIFLPKIRRFFVVGWFWLGRKKTRLRWKAENGQAFLWNKGDVYVFLWKWCSGWNGCFLRVVIGPPMVQPRVTQSARPIPFWSNSEGIWIRNK